MSRDLLYKHPAIQELIESFKLHDDFVQQKIKGWVDRWLAVGAMDVQLKAMPEEAEGSQILDGMFRELASKFVQPKAMASLFQIPDNKAVIRLTLVCLNRVPQPKNGGGVQLKGSKGAALMAAGQPV